MEFKDSNIEPDSTDWWQVGAAFALQFSLFLRAVNFKNFVFVVTSLMLLI